MIQLKVWQLRDFNKYASRIQVTGNENPFLYYLKLTKEGFLTKSSTDTIFSMKLDFAMPQTSMFAVVENNSFDEDILINEKILFSVVSTTRSEFITISKKDGNIIISDGKTHPYHPIEDVKMYPQLPEVPENVDMILDGTVIKSINVAKSFAATEESQANFQAIHIKNNFIAGISFHQFYIKEFENMQFPNIVLMPNHISILSQFEVIQYADSERFYFFKLGKELTFSFLKTSYNTPDFQRQLDMIKKLEEPHFKINKYDFVEFCQLSNMITDNSVPVCVLETKIDEDPEKNKTQLILKSDGKNKGNVRDIQVEGIAKEFVFNCKLIINSIKALPQDKFDCIVASRALIIFGEDNSFACFQGGQNYA